MRKRVCYFCFSEKIQTYRYLGPSNILGPSKYLEQHFYLLTKNWKYGGSMFGTEVVGGAQTE